MGLQLQPTFLVSVLLLAAMSLTVSAAPTLVPNPTGGLVDGLVVL